MFLWWSAKLKCNTIDRQRRGGYVELPEKRMLRAAEVYDGGMDYRDADVQCISGGGKMQMTFKLIEASQPL